MIRHYPSTPAVASDEDPVRQPHERLQRRRGVAAARRRGPARGPRRWRRLPRRRPAGRRGRPRGRRSGCRCRRSTPACACTRCRRRCGVAQLAAPGAWRSRARRAASAPDVIHANTPRTGLMRADRPRARGAAVRRARPRAPPADAGRARRARGARAQRERGRRRLGLHRRAPRRGPRRPVAQRVYNSIDHARFDPARVAPGSPARASSGSAADAALLGQVAQITPWKGQDTAIRALAELRRAGLDAHLVLVGQIAFGGRGVRYDNHAFLATLERLVARARRRRRGALPRPARRRARGPARAGPHLLPSWEEPFGLVTVESMALGTPPLVSARRRRARARAGRRDRPGAAAARPGAWAAAARSCSPTASACARMAAAGPAAAARFRDDVHAREMLAIYARAAPGAAAGGPPRRAGEAAPWPS